jgi:transaldolase
MKLKVKIFADGAEKDSIFSLNNNSMISGFTTNPTLMRKAGITDYMKFAKEILLLIKEKPISFEVFSDEFDEMYRQALKLSVLGENVYVKIPITNTKAQSSVELIKVLSEKGVKINVTAMMTSDQVFSVLPSLKTSPGAFVSVFAGRIADTGVDPVPILKEVLSMLKIYNNIELIWASPRELFNLVQANEIGCHIITVTTDILKKIDLLGKALEDFSLDTVKMFYEDAKSAGYII